MKKPSTNLPLNDKTDYGLCFACGPRNHAGLNLSFQSDGNEIITSFQGREEHQGFPGQLHGGIISALLDEVMSRCSLLEDRWTRTARMEVKFRHPILLDQKVLAIGKKIRQHGKVWETHAVAKLPDGTIAADARGTFVEVPKETLTRMSSDYPQRAKEWMFG